MAAKSFLTVIDSMQTKVLYIAAAIISLSPNPASSKLSIRSNTEIKKLQFFDANSMEVYPTCEISNATTKNYNLTKLRTGFYFVKIFTSEGVRMQNLMVMKSACP